MVGLYLLFLLGAIALLAYLASRYREYVDPEVELGAVRHGAVLVLTCCVVFAFVYTVVAPVFTDRTANPKYSSEAIPSQYSISGRVLDSSGAPIGNALVRATGPLFVAAVARNHETVTAADGKFRIDLLVGGGYNLYVSALGFEPTFLVSRLELADVRGDMSVPIMLRRRSEIQVQVGPAVVGPSQETANSIYPDSGGVNRVDIPALLMSQGVIASRDEIDSVEETTVSGSGWTAYLRDGETIYPVTTWLFNEPVCRITFVAFHAGRPDTVYILLRTGGLAFQLADPAPADGVLGDEPVAPLEELQQSDEPSDEGQMPTSEPRMDNPPSRAPTSWPPDESQPTIPANQPTVVPVAPLPLLVGAQPQSGSQLPAVPYPAPLVPAANTVQVVPPVAVPPVQQALPPIQQALPPPIQQALPPIQQALPPPIQQALPPVQQALPPIQQALPPPIQQALPPPIQQALPPVQQALPPVQQALPPVQQALPPIQQALPPPIQQALQNPPG